MNGLLSIPVIKKEQGLLNMKMRVQAQHLQKGDIVGSGEVVEHVIISSVAWPSNKVCVSLYDRSVLWGKYTMIGIERATAPSK